MQLILAIRDLNQQLIRRIKLTIPTYAIRNSYAHIYFRKLDFKHDLHSVNMPHIMNHPDTDKLNTKELIRQAGISCGFSAVGFSSIQLPDDEKLLQQWLDNSYHGDMSYMERHGTKRSRPDLLLPGTLSVISIALNYFPETPHSYESILQDDQYAAVSRYALGRDYHKLMRKMLVQFAEKVSDIIGTHSHRVFVDSAPVLEKALARNAGLGWIGKHTNLINRDRGSWFFLGEIYTSAALEPDQEPENHCGRCTKCLDICPTNAFVGPYKLDARKCISYLTIENHGPIPVELRPLMGNRIYGCDDCQIICPWNRFIQKTELPDFLPRNNLDHPQLIHLFEWTETEFMSRFEGSPIRRIGHERWLRNIAVALGNGTSNTSNALAALNKQKEHPSALVREHVVWAIEQLSK